MVYTCEHVFLYPQLGHVMPTLPCEEGPGQTAPAMPPGIRFDTIIGETDEVSCRVMNDL